MAISLLHKQKQTEKNTRKIDAKILYHLSIDKAFAYICTDVRKREAFLSVVSELTDDREEIIYRREILSDFSANPALFPELESLYKRFEELRISAKTAGREDFRMNVSGTVSLESAKNLLQANALCLKRSLLFVKAFGELLSKYSLRSTGLNLFLSSCREIYENGDFEQLILLCGKYEYFSTAGFLDFRFELNGDGRIESFETIDRKYVRITDPDLKKKGFSLFKKAEEITYPCRRLYPSPGDSYGLLAAGALNDLSNLFIRLSAQIFERFSPVFEELDFYFAALRYIELLESRKIPLCYPSFSDNMAVDVKDLYDLYLSVSSLDASKTVPNDLSSSGIGLLVFGDNGSGKTVYLRSIGTMQILAQAGLPIPCRSAKIPLYSQIATQFSESEKEFTAGNDAGRFEQEVRELSAIIDGLNDGALVFLNETFQTTAYKEGAEALYHLLCCFTECGINWILVSHLHRLKELLAGKVKVMQTKEGYKICTATP